MFSEISDDKREYVINIITKDSMYREFFMDEEEHGKHPVVLDEQGVLRWKRDPMIDALVGTRVLDLNNLAVAVHQGKISPEWQRHIARSCGYSLDGYSTLSYIQAWYEQKIKDDEDVESSSLSSQEEKSSNQKSSPNQKSPNKKIKV
jgi:hypothetical protein